MRHLLLLVGLLGSIFFTTANAQVGKYGDFNVIESKEFILTYTDGEVVQGRTFTADSRPSFAMLWDLQAQVWNFAISDAPFSFDNTGKANRVNLRIIVDNGQVFNVGGSIANSRGKVNLMFNGDLKITDFYGMILQGRTLFVEVSGASNEAHVFQFSLNGLRESGDAINNIKDKRKNNNPFGAKKSANPFKG